MEQVLVIGGGIIGQLCALELSARGAQVTILDAFDHYPPASWAGGGILSPLFPWRFSDGLSALCAHAVADYRALNQRIVAAGGEDAEVSAYPLLCLCDDHEQDVQAWASRWQRAVECCDAGVFYPHLGGRTAWLLRDSGSIRNPRLLKGLRTLLAKQGVTIIRALVEDIDCGATLSVRTNNGDYCADRLVIAAGHSSAALLQQLGVAHELLPVKGQMLRYASVPDMPQHVVLSEQGYLIPRQDGSLLVGSTLEPNRVDVEIDQGASTHLQKVAAQLWPVLASLVPSNHWAGVRPGHSTDVPIIDVLQTDKRIWMCTGHYRNGLVSAPASARLLAQRMCNETPEFKPMDYSVSSPGSSDSF